MAPDSRCDATPSPVPVAQLRASCLLKRHGPDGIPGSDRPRSPRTGPQITLAPAHRINLYGRSAGTR